MEATTNTSILINDRNIAERRLVSIARAIEAHKNEQRRKPYPARAEDLNLYRRAREILGADRI
ncbi:MAG TPA: hypothetical protein VIZ61_10520 [Solirubrobacterales bacterium]|jgi:hypothetical protein